MLLSEPQMHVIKDKVILSEVSGRVEAGEMLASEYSTNRASRASNHVEWHIWHT